MSLFSKIGKALKGVVKKVGGSVLGKVAASVIPGVGPVAASVIAAGAGAAASALQKKKARPSMSLLPALPGGGGRYLPPIAKAVKTVAPYAAGAAAGFILDGDGQTRKRRRRKGITAKDLSSFKRVARLVDKYSKPVHHFRNFKKG